jgi:hypothetical protein
MNLKFGSFVGAVAITAALSGCSISIGGSNLDIQKPEDEMANGIQEQTDIAVTVSCPEDVEMKVGNDFTCTATDAEGNQATVAVTQEDDEGNIEWELMGGTDLAGRDVEAEIVKGLKDQNGVTATVDCPSVVPIEANTSFNCTATSDGGDTATIVVTQTEDQGSYTWEVQ